MNVHKIVTVQKHFDLVSYSLIYTIHNTHNVSYVQTQSCFTQLVHVDQSLCLDVLMYYSRSKYTQFNHVLHNYLIHTSDCVQTGKCIKRFVQSDNSMKHLTRSIYNVLTEQRAERFQQKHISLFLFFFLPSDILDWASSNVKSRGINYISDVINNIHDVISSIRDVCAGVSEVQSELISR